MRTECLQAMVAVCETAPSAAHDPADLRRLETTNRCVNSDLADADLRGMDLRGAVLADAVLVKATIANVDQNAIAVLEEARWLSPARTRSGQTVGRENADYRVNPKVYLDVAE